MNFKSTNVWQLVSLFLVLFPMAHCVEASEDLTTPSIDRLIEFVGLNAQINRAADLISIETVQALQQCNFSEGDSELVAVFLQQLYAPAKLRDSARTHLRESITDEQINELIAWIESPLGKKVYSAETSIKTATESELVSMELKSNNVVIGETRN